MTTNINSITIGLPVSDLEKAIEWYRQLLGEVEEINPAPGVYEFLIIPCGWLQLFESNTSSSSAAVVRLESRYVEASRKLVSSLGTEVGELQTVPEAVKYFGFRDPFGNQLSFYELLT